MRDSVEAKTKLSLASRTWDEAEKSAILRVIESGWFTMGENVARFERRFAERFGVKHAVMVNSGSSANLVGVAALCYRRQRALQRGDEVIVPAISWATTYYPLQQYGLRLRFVDVEIETLNMDVAKLEQALTPRTRMVVVVNILGNPAALDRIRAFCDAHDLILFEDNCESLGAELKGKATGTFGDVGTFSLFFSHQISTMEGGVLVTNDDELAQLARSLRAHGWTRDLPSDSPLFEKRPDDFYEAYRFILPGYNLRPLELSGAVGLEQFKKLDRLLATRRANAQRFVELFGKDERFIIQRENGKSSWFSFTLILHPRIAQTRTHLAECLKASGIEYRIITGGCFLRHDVIRYFDYTTAGDIVNANIAHDRGLFIGNHPTDIRAQLERVYEVLDRALARGG